MGTGYWLKPVRIGDLPHFAAAMAKSLLRRSTVPRDCDIRSRPAGFAGIARNPSPDDIMVAARRGFYPHAHIGPMKWWSPPSRGVMMLDDVHLSKRFRRWARTPPMTVTIDQAFQQVVESCAAPRPGRPRLTWLTPRAQALYNRLHAQGGAHSVEVWDADGKMVGGVFGVDVAPIFSALSMFHSKDDASKLALASLYHHLAAWGFCAVDHQVLSPWVRDLGGQELSRGAYCALLLRTMDKPATAWQFQLTPAETAQWCPSAGTETAMRSATAPNG